ncbi:MAG: hypothetical protein D6791_13020 [Chloroflexi bacterium]|nr:MAG: hypothetical protein D6791_13020 [Chloroflexota bacterium]
MRTYLAGLLLTLSLVVLAAPGGRVRAHGGGTAQLSNEPLGPYVLTVWTNPDPATVGKLHITAAIATADTGEPVTDATVQVLATASDGAVTRVQAGHQGALTPYFYEADLELGAPGRWQFTILLDDGQSSYEAGFTLEVRGQGFNWLLFAVVAVVVMVSGWMGWLLARGGPSRRSRPARRG